MTAPTCTASPVRLQDPAPGYAREMSKPRDYSSQSFTPGASGPPRSYATNKLDTSGKSREKDDMVGLNDKFVRLIDKVKHLEDENKKLDTKLKILKEKEDYEGKIDDIVNQLKNEMEEQVENLIRDHNKLQADLIKTQDEVEDTKKSYEEELMKKADLENDFIVSKKEVDEGHLEAVDLVLELEDLMGKLDFLRVGYDEEVKELESQVQNETVVLPENSKRSLDLDGIVNSVKSQYVKMATRSREEAEQWNQRKMDALVFDAGQREQEVRDIKRDISDMLRQIQRLNGDLEALLRKEETLKKEINDLREEGDCSLEKARQDIAQLEEALRRAKQDLARQIREYQELMNLKLALDIEIATYRKLLEGEEERMNNLMRAGDVHPPSKHHPPAEKPHAPESTVATTTTIIPPTDAVSRKRLLIRVEVEHGRVVSESSHYTED